MIELKRDEVREWVKKQPWYVGKKEVVNIINEEGIREYERLTGQKYIEKHEHQ